MNQELLIILVIVLAFPIGYLIAYLARDELKKGRKYFKMIIGAGIAAIFLFYMFELEEKARYSLTLTVVFIIIVSFISLFKSKDKRFISRK